MPRNVLGSLPFPPLVRLDTDEPIGQEALAQLLRRSGGVSICVRSVEGHPQRGGYFFHILPGDETLEACEVFNFEQISVLSLSLERLTAFVNHCAGLAFDEQSFQLCQTVVNFRLDPEPSSEQDA